jgi:hypothetical protein
MDYSISNVAWSWCKQLIKMPLYWHLIQTFHFPPQSCLGLFLLVWLSLLYRIHIYESNWQSDIHVRRLICAHFYLNQCNSYKNNNGIILCKMKHKNEYLSLLTLWNNSACNWSQKTYVKKMSCITSRNGKVTWQWHNKTVKNYLLTWHITRTWGNRAD